MLNKEKATAIYDGWAVGTAKLRQILFVNTCISSGYRLILQIVHFISPICNNVITLERIPNETP